MPSGTVMNLFKCDKCQYKAVSNNLLKIHHRNFHTDGKFTCDICGHQETRKHSLQKHKMILHGRAKYFCNQCDYGSTKKQNLVQHQKSVHEELNTAAYFAVMKQPKREILKITKSLCMMDSAQIPLQTLQLSSNYKGES